jgi:ABC-type multidrug transport system ATPase subunit
LRIEARGLGRRFGEVRALADVSFEVPPGRRVALIGPNGSGKSTLNRIVMGLLRFEGEIRLDARCPFRERLAVARRIAYVPQAAPQLGVPVGELLRAASRLRGIPPGALGAVAEALELNLEAVADRPFRSLSGGTQQKLLIALALGCEASLLVLDEPTGSLDPRSRERFFPLFDKLAPEATLLLCSHRLEEVRQLVDHVLMLSEGNLVYDGPAAEFLAASTTSLMEVCVAGEAAERWLRERGFRRGAGGWWFRTLSPVEKRQLLPELTAALGPALRDLNARDLERLEEPEGGERSRGQ